MAWTNLFLLFRLIWCRARETGEVAFSPYVHDRVKQAMSAFKTARNSMSIGAAQRCSFMERCFLKNIDRIGVL